MLNVVGVHLNQAGISVVTAKDGAEGIEAILSNEPDLVCLDFTMPYMNTGNDDIDPRSSSLAVIQVLEYCTRNLLPLHRICSHS